jgi:excisionase family DNA binding protein
MSPNLFKSATNAVAYGDSRPLCLDKRKLMIMQDGDLLTKQQLADYDRYLLTKQQLAERLGLKVRGVESLVERRKIPALRISGRCVRFSWPRVLAALQKFEFKEIE